MPELLRQRYMPLEVSITEAQLVRALDRDDKFKHELQLRGQKHLRNSIKKGERDFVGFLGEEIIYDLYSGGMNAHDMAWSWVAGQKYDWDMRLIAARRGRIDVKTKLQTYSAPPGPHYWATVCDKNTRQDCDWYCFVRVHYLCQKAWVLGFMPKHTFFQSAHKYLKGEIDPTSHNDWPFKEDCWNMAAKNLMAAPVNVTGLQALFLEHDLNACA